MGWLLVVILPAQTGEPAASPAAWRVHWPNSPKPANVALCDVASKRVAYILLVDPVIDGPA